MKHLYALLVFFLTTVAFSQATDLYFSKYGEGSHQNKFLEIYNGTGADVDLSAYKVELYANGSDSVTNVLEMSGILAAGDVYVIANSAADSLILAKADTTSRVTYFNGDDALVLKKNDQPLDVIGVVGEDPGDGWDVAGVHEATKDHTLIRKSTVCSPTTDWAASAGTNADDSQWHVLARDAGWDELGSHSGCTSQPELYISEPADGQVFPPPTTEVTVTFTVNNFNVAQPSQGDGYIVYALNGQEANKYDTNPIQLQDLTNGEYTVAMKLVDNNGQDLDPAVGDTVSFSIADYTQVSDLAALRASQLGEYYEVTGEIILTGLIHTRRFNKFYAQDNSAGIMIYDPQRLMNGEYQRYDGITGIRGKLKQYNGMLEIELTEDPGGATSTGNTVTPQEITVAQFTANHEDYESELIKFNRVRIDTTQGSTFESRHTYTVYQNSDSTFLYPAFPELVGKPIPREEVILTAIAGEFRGTPNVYPRDENDFEPAQAVGKDPIPGLRVYPNPVSQGQVQIFTPQNLPKDIRINDLTGKQIMRIHIDRNARIRLPLRAGIYLMRVDENGRASIIKLLVK